MRKSVTTILLRRCRGVIPNRRPTLLPGGPAAGRYARCGRERDEGNTLVEPTDE
jgi:hypothetical protein